MQPMQRAIALRAAQRGSVVKNNCEASCLASGSTSPMIFLTPAGAVAKAMLEEGEYGIRHQITKY